MHRDLKPDNVLVTRDGRVKILDFVLGYKDTLRAMRIAPDGASLMYAFLHPQADIWILEGLGK